MSKFGLAPPFLKRVTLLPDKVDRERFPFTRFPGLLRDDFSLEFSRSITFFTGENGTGKSTVLEAIATLCGFHIGGGGSDHQLHATTERTHSLLAEALRPSWLPKVSKGFFSIRIPLPRSPAIWTTLAFRGRSMAGVYTSRAMANRCYRCS